MKLFQIEEPEGGPADQHAPGAAIGIDASGAAAEIAIAVGGNSEILADRSGFELALAVPPYDAAVAEWQALFEGARLRAERALARPVTHAVIVVAATANETSTVNIASAAEQASLVVLRLAARTDLAPGTAPAAAAAVVAEDLAPRPLGECE
ncbi:MAG: hypothetical protein JO081_07950 [Alphaproteobacteria bacterium]|nr:hypothetical protein [Alphaproteobacteria bacterium]